jgi:hypothetical protein
MTPEVRLCVDGFSLGTWQNLAVGVYSQAATVAAAEGGRREYEAMARRFPDGFVIMIIVEDNIPLPDHDARIAIAEAMQFASPYVIASCAVHEARGFRGIAIRSVITALMAASRAPYPSSTFSTVEEAAEWLAQYISPPTTPGELVAKVAAFRSGLPSPSMSG